MTEEQIQMLGAMARARTTSLENIAHAARMSPAEADRVLVGMARDGLVLRCRIDNDPHGRIFAYPSLLAVADQSLSSCQPDGAPGRSGGSPAIPVPENPEAGPGPSTAREMAV